ncbi:hypothetical protein [Kribbella sp. ALI-6-A]|nr:hypothetical protein [Kribbella sp. ALI-6-A]
MQHADDARAATPHRRGFPFGMHRGGHFVLDDLDQPSETVVSLARPIVG